MRRADCENNLCIYQSHNKCRLSSIFINSVGMCESCIILNFSPQELKDRKEKMFMQITERTLR